MSVPNFFQNGKQFSDGLYTENLALKITSTKENNKITTTLIPFTIEQMKERFEVCVIIISSCTKQFLKNPLDPENNKLLSEAQQEFKCIYTVMQSNE